MKNANEINILVACEESQAVCIEFRKLGFNAFSCDILECSGGHPEWHLHGSVMDYLHGYYECKCGMIHEETAGKYGCCGVSKLHKWDAMIAFPPCTHLAVSGSRHFVKKREDGRQREAINLFMKFLDVDCELVAVENPIGIISGNYIKEHFPDLAEKYGLPIKHSQIIQPYEYGDPVKKSTCLWLKGLPKLEPTNNVADDVKYYVDSRGIKQSEWNVRQLEIDGKKYGYDTAEFKKHRSKTFDGIANAMAVQWSSYACR